MKKQTIKAYQIVLKDLRSQLVEKHIKCKDKSPICVECITNRLADDLEYLFDLFKGL